MLGHITGVRYHGFHGFCLASVTVTVLLLYLANPQSEIGDVIKLI